jgi:hypothetical protein
LALARIQTRDRDLNGPLRAPETTEEEHGTGDS